MQGVVSTENSIAESSQLVVFPNPVQGVINLKIANIEEEATATLSDLTGRTVLTQRISLKNGETTAISLKNEAETVPTGNYVLSVATKSGIFTKKITITP